MKLALGRSPLLTPRNILLGLSIVSLAICACAGTAHYRTAAWGDPWQPIGWLLSMLFLLAAFLPGREGLATGFKFLIKPKTAFFVFWILFFIVSHLWNFYTAPWNGDALFDESGWDLWFLKSYVIGHPYQAAWFHPPVLSRETLFHYYIWAFLRLFGFNILSYEAALFCIWLTTFVFSLLLVDLLFDSYIITSVTGLIFNFFPFAFIYTFAGYRYPMAVALAVVSLYFLYVGFRNEVAVLPFHRRNRRRLMFGQLHIRQAISDGACDCCTSVRGVLLEELNAKCNMEFAGRGCVWLSNRCRHNPSLYRVQSRNDYTLYEAALVRDFWHAVQSAPFPNGIRPFTKQLYDCFFSHSRLHASLFPILCQFRCRIIGF